jgi:hypothetical protein
MGCTACCARLGGEKYDYPLDCFLVQPTRQVARAIACEQPYDRDTEAKNAKRPCVFFSRVSPCAYRALAMTVDASSSG